MKTIRHFFHVAALLLCLSASPARAVILEFQANMIGPLVVPPQSSPGFGSMNLSVDTNTMTYGASGSYFALAGTATLAHGHEAPPGANGPVILPMTVTGGQNGVIFGSGTLSPATLSSLLAGLVYVDVHTSFFPGGEIRGQLVQLINETEPPVLLAPADGAVTTGPIEIRFNLPEVAAPGSLRIHFGGVTLHLASSQNVAGLHGFFIDPANPGAAPQVASVDNGPITDGSYAVQVIYSDVQGGAAASDQNTGITVDTTTLTPVLFAPLDAAGVGSPIEVFYALPEAARPGSVEVKFHDFAQGVEVVLTGDSTTESMGGHSLLIDPANPGGSPGIAVATGGAIVDGSYSVIVSYQDALANPRAFDFNFDVVVANNAPLVPEALLVIGSGMGVDPTNVTTQLFPGADPVLNFSPYDSGFGGGVRVGTADITGDGTLDIITGAGPGAMGGHVKVFDGRTGAEVRSFFAFPGFPGGVTVAAGDVNRDGRADIIVGAGDGGNAHVKVFSGTNGAEIRSFFAFPGFPGEVRVASADLNGDDHADIITGAGPGSPGGHVKVFDGNTGAEIRSFLAFPGFNGGVFVAGGDVNGDGTPDIEVAADAGGLPHVKVFSGIDTSELHSFLAFDAGFAGGVRVASGDVNMDGRADVIVAAGPGAGPHVKVFSGATGAEIGSFFPAVGGTGGLYVGAGSGPLGRTVDTNPATNVTPLGAQLNGFVKTSTFDERLSFQYGTSPALTGGGVIAGTPDYVFGGGVEATITANLTDLLPGTTYYFRLLANDNVSVIAGALQSFSTPPNLPPTGGTFTVAPPSPVAEGTLLTGLFAGWIDPEGDLPLSYEVREGLFTIASRSTDASPGFMLPAGTHALTGRVYDSFGLVTEVGPVTVEVGGTPGAVTHELLFTRGTAVPGAGVDPYIPAGATWFSFGVPAVDRDGTVAVVGKWKNPPGSAQGTYSSGLFVNGVLKVYLGQAVNGIVDTTFKKFKDPVISGAHLALIATIEGTGVDSSNDTVVIRVRPTGEVTVLAREGQPAEGAGGSVFKTFKSVSIDGGYAPVGPTGILYTATLNKEAGTLFATSANDYGAWLFRNDVTSLVVREGGAAAGLGTLETVKSFTLLKTISASMGQGRGQTGPSTVSLAAKTSEGRSVLLRYEAGALGAFAFPGDSLFSMALPLATWKTFGPLSESTSHIALRGVLNNVDGAGKTGIFLGVPSAGAFEPVVQLGDTAPVLGGFAFKSVKDPVLAADSASVAFRAVLDTGDSATDTALFWLPEGGDLTLLAQEGNPAVGGGVYKTFTSLAIPGGETGPLFLASLLQGEGGVDKTNDVGVWGVDGLGDVLKFFREGDEIVTGKFIKTITVLKAVSGSNGARSRAFNANAEVVSRVYFLDGTSAVMKTTVPTAGGGGLGGGGGVIGL